MGLMDRLLRRCCFYAVALGLLFPGSFAHARTPSDPYRNNLKVTVLSLFSGSTKLTYERALSDHRSLELTAGVIGWGGDWLNNNHSSGALGRLAYKFIFHGRPGLQGFYLKPELAYSSFFYDAPEEAVRKRTDRLAVMGCLGYQLVFHRFVFDVFGGLGGALGSGNDFNYYHGFIGLGPSSHAAFTAGFKLGIAF